MLMKLSLQAGKESRVHKGYFTFGFNKLNIIMTLFHSTFLELLKNAVILEITFWKKYNSEKVAGFELFM